VKLSIKTWLQVEPLLMTAFDMEAAARAAWLDTLDTTHPEVAPVLRRMLAAHDRAERRRELETVPRIAPAPGWSSAYAPGARIGPFELVRTLGQGGMGEVWLARQADGRVEREVALKLPALHQAGDVWRERFKRERDILARLEHPNIARLYDAGVTESGQPWLAMEWVEGASLSAFVAARTLSMRERLALFRQVLAAVAHAHRHLVVHRDLKPANILIDAAGQVKLLDFGIAKLVDEAAAPDPSGELTRLGGRVMTLRYAAPEQVEEEAITTATDIYALGVILHELVTGLSPYRAVREGRPLTEAMLLREEIAVPNVSGDLDAIILKAMRRDPAARYATVERLDEDILAHLERRPVKARAGTWRYLAGRFAARHKLPLAAAAAVLVALLGGLVIAERERDRALAEKARAERHFASVRKLANSFIFDMHREIEPLPGSLKAREMLVRTSLEYLNSLSAEAAGDPSLMRELAEAYRKIGDVQGQVGGANTGDKAASLRNYEQSKRLYVALDALTPRDAAALRSHWTLSILLARARAMANNPEWQPETAVARDLAARLVALPGADRVDRARVAIAMVEQANMLHFKLGQTPEVEAQVARGIEMLEAIAAEVPGDPEMRRYLSAAYQKGAGIFNGLKRTKESTRRAIEYNRKSLALAREVQAVDPLAARVNRFELTNLTTMSEMLWFVGEHAESGRVIGEAIALAQRMQARDPDDAGLALQVISMLAQATTVASEAGDTPRAVRHGREALAVAGRLPKSALQSIDARNSITEAKYALAEALMASAAGKGRTRAEKLALLREARSLLTDSLAFAEEVRVQKLVPYPEEIAREMMEAHRKCNAEIARLEASPA